MSKQQMKSEQKTQVFGCSSFFDQRDRLLSSQFWRIAATRLSLKIFARRPLKGGNASHVEGDSVEVGSLDLGGVVVHVFRRKRVPNSRVLWHAAAAVDLSAAPSR